MLSLNYLLINTGALLFTLAIALALYAMKAWMRRRRKLRTAPKTTALPAVSPPANGSAADWAAILGLSETGSRR